MPARTDTIGPFNLELESSREIEVPAGCDEVRFQSRLLTGTWTAATFITEWSLTGGTAANWVNLDEPLTFSSADVGVISKPRYLGCVRFLRLRVNVTQSGTPGEAEIVVAQDATALGALRWRAASGGAS